MFSLSLLNLSIYLFVYLEKSPKLSSKMKPIEESMEDYVFEEPAPFHKLPNPSEKV